MVLVNVAMAVDVGVVVEFEDGSLFTKCVTVNEETNGRDILEESGLDILWSPTGVFGSLICKINGEGTEISGDFCEYFGEFWNFNILIDNSWEHMPVGHDGPGDCWNRDMASWDGHYCGVEGDVIGYKFTEFGAPPVTTFDEICPEIRLAISDLEVEVDGKDKTRSDGDTIKNVKPGSKVEFRVEVENLNKKNGLDINGVSIDITIEGIDNDLEEESDDFDLKSGSKKSKTLRFDMPLEIDEDDYSVIIEVNGEQEDGTEFVLEWQLDLEIDKEKHSVVIDKAVLDDSATECGEYSRLEVKLINLGSESEDVNLNIENADLGILIKEDVELEEGEDGVYSNSYELYIREDIAADAYPIKITALYDEGDEKETKIVNLDVECLLVAEEAEQETSEIEEEEEESQEEMTETTGQVVSKFPINKRGLAVILIIIGELLVVVMFIVVLAWLLKT